MKATAIANSNIALTKYWGKRDKKMMLPLNGSTSMTLDGFFTKTTVEFGDFEKDVFIVSGEEVEGRPAEKVYKHLNLIREKAGIKQKVKVASENNFPTAAGLASSASGFAALSVAGAKAAGLELNEQELSILSRRGSGSASRSVLGGFVEWKKGEKEDGSDSYGEQIAAPGYWPEFRMVATIVTEAQKRVSSTSGMAQTVETCPLYPGWLSSVEADIEAVKKGIKEKDLTLVGSTAEHNALKMHATMIATNPPIIYWIPASVEIIHAVMTWREEGLECYFTMDAGPNVKVMCLEKDQEEVVKKLEDLGGVVRTEVSKPGPAARLVKEHLF